MILYKNKLSLLILLPAVVCITSCTKNFNKREFNTDPTGIYAYSTLTIDYQNLGSPFN